MSRIALADIKRLTFFQGAQTKARRLSPIPQLQCLGKPCSLYQPEVVRCTNEGGEGTEIDWKCEADLPESLRFGRVEVSCEGWSHAGDPYVSKGSCGLDYRLVQIPNEDNIDFRHRSRWFASRDIAGTLFSLVWIIALVSLLYFFLRSCLRGRQAQATPSNYGPFSSWGGPGGFFRRPQDDPPRYPPPPPYTDHGKDTPGQNSSSGPGFWTGLGLGGLGATAAARYLRERNPSQRVELNGDRRAYDWERAREPPRPTRPRTQMRSEDRGEGPSNLGSIRRATGLGSSSVR